MYSLLETHLSRDLVDLILEYLPLSSWNWEPQWIKPYLKARFLENLPDDLSTLIQEYVSYRSIVRIDVNPNQVLYWSANDPSIFRSLLESAEKDIFASFRMMDDTQVFEISASFTNQDDCFNYVQQWFCSSKVPWIN